MNSAKLVSILLSAVFLTAFGAQTPPERIVTANTVTSNNNPKAQISLPREATYVGGDRWVLYDVADCELHVFVEADAKRVIQRMYWIQFEGYLPSRPELTHDYSRDTVEKFHDTDFYVRSRFGPSGDPVKAGSDTEHVQKLLKASGFTEPKAMMNVRLVQLLDAKGRNELMIIYAESLDALGIDWKDLLPNGKSAEQWPQMQKELKERAEAKIQIQR